MIAHKLLEDEPTGLQPLLESLAVHDMKKEIERIQRRLGHVASAKDKA